MALSGMRGLSAFISEIRNCKNKDQERLHVDNELSNIRTRFKNKKRVHVPVSNGERLKLYEKMSRDLDEHGALFLKHGETSQSLLLSDLFDMENGSVTPALKAAIPPVRANVLHLSTEYSLPISKAVRDVFSPTLSEVIWFHNSERYHFSMFHASHPISPVPASEEEVSIFLLHLHSF
ncbi:putative armadillo-like helical protein [Helianthus anomalus]